VCFLVPGCWSSEPRVDGVFSQEEWTFLQTFKLPQPELCPESYAGSRCDAAVRLGKHLFFDPGISGSITHELDNEPGALGSFGQAGVVSCASCHDSTAFFTDTRSQPGQVSIGTGYTKRNALGLVNIGYKRQVARDNCRLSDADAYCANVYSWNGQYSTSGAVLDLALRKAMNSDHETLAAAVAKNHSTEYLGLFGGGPCAVGQSSGCDSPDRVFENLVNVFEAYERRLDRTNSRFDRYIAGDRTALRADEKRGLELFIGKAMCVDCHRPPLLSDLKFHNTGVPQRGPHVPSSDNGLCDHVSSSCDPNDPAVQPYVGEFLTQPLRNVAETGPYMHAGQLGSLADVIELYRHGGGDEGYLGVKDPRIQPLEIDDDEARALEAFLRSLTSEGNLPEYLTRPEID
jgi:cytochrome c peroxidase